MRQGHDLGQCKTLPEDCKSSGGERSYYIDFFGRIKMNGLEKDLWTDS